MLAVETIELCHGNQASHQPALLQNVNFVVQEPRIVVLLDLSRSWEVHTDLLSQWGVGSPAGADSFWSLRQRQMPLRQHPPAFPRSTAHWRDSQPVQM